jgi:RimJ/RimL family protein N-acetyltransferase
VSTYAHRAVEVPTLETGRLRLRAHRLEDFVHCAAMWADPEVNRYIGGTPHTEEESWARLLRYTGHWSLLGFGYWLVEEISSGSFIGEVGFADYKRELPALRGLPEIGWAFSTHARGKGYATEAVRVALTWGDAHFPSPRTACIIHPENLASIRVAEKCAYHEFHRTTYKSHPTIMFIRDRPN